MKTKTLLFTVVAALLLAACSGSFIPTSPPLQQTPDATAENLFDFGDAPESFAVDLPDGGRASDPYQVWLGPPDSVASLEEDAKITDDAEDGLSASGNTAFITISKSADTPRGVFYLNALRDINSDGQWLGSGSDEWFIKNLALDMLPGETITVEATLPKGSWIRLVVSKEPIESAIWNGSGYWKIGEVEDYPELGWAETPTPWLPPWTSTPVDTPTPTPKKVITTIPGGNPTFTPTPTKPEFICTKCGGPTPTPTETLCPPPHDGQPPTNEARPTQPDIPGGITPP